MVETGIVLLLVGGLAGIGLAPVPWILNVAGALLLFGFAIGVPTGFWYHVALGRTLSAREALPSRWWLRPTTLHPRLRPEERSAVLRWFYAGGIGFGFTALGCIALGGAAVRLVLQGP